MLLLGILIAAAVLCAVGICFLTGIFATAWWLLWLILIAIGCFVALVALAFFFLWFMCAIVDINKPQKHDSKFYRTMTYLYIDAIMAACWVHVHAQGLEKTPKEGRFLLVCNHLNDSDPAILLSAFKKSQLAFVSKYENYNMFLVGKLMHKIMCQPINRENDREALKTILECIRLMKEDEVSIAVFPEGYIHDDHLFYPFRPGVFKIAQRTKVPIVVCTLHGTPVVFHNAARLKRTDVQLHVLTVIQPEEYEGKSTVELAQHIHDIMAEDIGYDGVWHGAENT